MSTDTARKAALAIQREADERVVSGIRLLDERVPGWKNRVNIAILDIGSGGCCVIGQVFGDWSDGINRLSLGKPADYGFFKRDHDDITYADLTAAWKRALTA